MSPREDAKIVRCVLDWGHQNGMTPSLVASALFWIVLATFLFMEGIEALNAYVNSQTAAAMTTALTRAARSQRAHGRLVKSAASRGPTAQGKKRAAFEQAAGTLAGVLPIQACSPTTCRSSRNRPAPRRCACVRHPSRFPAGRWWGRSAARGFPDLRPEHAAAASCAR